jgi:hypothetical protein
MLNTLIRVWRITHVLALALPALAQSTLTVEPVIAHSTYCSTQNGNITLWVRLVIKYQNNLGEPVLLPTPSCVVAYELFRDEKDFEMGRPLRKFAPKLPPMLDASKIDHSQPDPTLFELIQPSGVAQRLQNISLAVSGPRVRGLPSGNYYLRVTIDPWPANPKAGENLAHLWKARGKLVLDRVTLTPVRLHIQEAPVAEPCRLRID